ncbi:MAG: hypothetical protein PHV59_02305 [Victivallales bacterium]|nr:hypothetical protein [Victivallales bacterium]
MSQSPCSGSAIAAGLGLSPVRVNRLLKTLTYLGLAYRTSSRKYTLGPAIHVLAAQSLAASGLLARALPQLQRLAGLNKTVALGVLWKDQVCYLYHNMPEKDVFAGLNGLKLYPARRSSIGLALLAALPEKQLPHIWGTEVKSGLAARLRRIRKKGYAAVKRRDHISLAAVIGNPAYAAIAITGIPPDEDLKPLVAMLKEAVEIIQ